MRSTFAAQLFHHIRCSRVERVGGAKRSREFQFLLGDVDRDHLRAQRSSELHREMPQTTYAENCKALPGDDTGALQCAIDSQSSTEQRSSLKRGNAIGNLQ